MYKNQLQELAQRSCFNLPSYTCIREGPDHAPRFKATVNFNGEVFESPNYCTTLRQAEHAAAEVALNTLSNRGPSQALAARILDETGVYKNLLQEIAQRAGAALPVYTTVHSGLGHLPVFTCTVELAGISFTGEPAKNKKQAEKNAAMAAWSSLKQLAKQVAASSSETESNDEQEQITIARALVNYRLKEMTLPSKGVPTMPRRPASLERKRLLAPLAESKILPLIPSKPAGPRNRVLTTAADCSQLPQPKVSPSFSGPPPFHGIRHVRYPTPRLPYLPYRAAYHGSPSMAPPVTIRNAVPVFSAMPLPPPMCRPPQVVAPPVQIRPVVRVFAAPPPPPRPSPSSPSQVAASAPTPSLRATQPAASPRPIQPAASPPTAAQQEHHKEVNTIDRQIEIAAMESLKQLEL
ncbi:double-stranded RNA-binding protein 2 [Nymphaea colorata]|nr:double-stranded RNA-binding protein 2 [Nymphaea colorata]